MNIPRMLVGCMPLGGSWDDKPYTREHVTRTQHIIDAAMELGLTAFDHADIYCRGKSETVFGLALRQRPGLRDQIFLQSKCGIRFAHDSAPGVPHRYDFSREHILVSVEGILRRLQTDRLDSLLLHRPDLLAEPEEIAAAFDELAASGKVLQFGVSNHNGPRLERLAATVRQPLFANQVEFSLKRHELVSDEILTDRLEARYTASHGLLETCARLGACIQAWGPLAQGSLITPGPEAPLQEQQLAAAIRRLAEEHGSEPEAIAIAWILRHPARISPITGTSHPARLKKCAAARNLSLSREDWYRLLQAARGVPLP